MSERRGHTFRIYLSSDGRDRPGDGSAAQPCCSLAAALQLARERYSGASPQVCPLAGHDQLELIVVGPDRKAGRRRPTRQYSIDPLAPADAADGGELAPWNSLDAAASWLIDRHAAGSLPIATGDILRLSVREVFSATPLDRKKRRQEWIARSILLCVTLTLALPLVLIFGFLLVKAWPVLSWSFIVDNPRNNMTAGGIWAPLVGTMYLVVISLLVAAPIGILAGVYLNEYAGDNWFTRVVNLAVVNLAGVPSIVHALFGVGAFVTFAHMGASVMAASCTLAVMTLPVIITSTREALAAVPRSFREACWNLGASRWQTIRTIVLPNSISGILTGVILQVARAAGETAPILFTGATFSMAVPNSGLASVFPFWLDDKCMALSYHLYALMTQVKGATRQQIASGHGLPLEDLQYGTAAVLIGLVLLVNSLSIGLRVYLRSRKKW